MNDEASLESVAFRKLGLACLAAAEQSTLVDQVGARGAVDCAINAAAAKQRAICGIHDRVAFEARDVAPDRPHVAVNFHRRTPSDDAERQASAGARDGVKGKGAISLRALRCMR